MRKTNLLASVALMAGMSATFASSGAVALPREHREPRIGEFRKGRRHFYGFPSFAQLANGQNRAGTKLLKKMRKGVLTKNSV